MSLSDKCEKCEQIKSKESSDGEDSISFSDSLSKHTNSESTRWNTDQSKSEKTACGARKLPAYQNKTFSSEKIREIERRNAMLVDRILYHSRRPSQYKTTTPKLPKVTSSEINRRRHQEKIIRENEMLLKKIQSVKPAVRYT